MIWETIAIFLCSKKGFQQRIMGLCIYCTIAIFWNLGIDSVSEGVGTGLVTAFLAILMQQEVPDADPRFSWLFPVALFVVGIAANILQRKDDSKRMKRIISIPFFLLGILGIVLHGSPLRFLAAFFGEFLEEINPISIPIMMGFAYGSIAICTVLCFLMGISFFSYTVFQGPRFTRIVYKKKKHKLYLEPVDPYTTCQHCSSPINRFPVYYTAENGAYYCRKHKKE